MNMSSAERNKLLVALLNVGYSYIFSARYTTQRYFGYNVEWSRDTAIKSK